jgi:hypothetical protein
MAIIATMALIGVRGLSLVAVFISLKGKAQIPFFCHKSAATFSQICLAKPASFSLDHAVPGFLARSRLARRLVRRSPESQVTHTVLAGEVGSLREFQTTGRSLGVLKRFRQ